MTPEEMFTMRPSSDSRSAAACMSRNGAPASTATRWSKVSSDVWANGPQLLDAAALGQAVA